MRATNMVNPKLLSAALLVATSVLASGCYCPTLSGRYGEVGCFPPCPVVAAPPQAAPPPAEPPPAEDCKPSAEVASEAHRPVFSGGLLRHGGRLALRRSQGQVPSRQGPAYASPQAKFHPVPTRPVFEPEPAYPPLQLIEAAGSNPLRPAELLHGR
jgi:hypothetical protein